MPASTDRCRRPALPPTRHPTARLAPTAPRARSARSALTALLALSTGTALLLSACALAPVHAPAAPAPAPAPASAPPPAAPSAPPPAPASAAQPDPAERADRAARALLAYNERLRGLAPAELAQELARAPVDPLEQPGMALEQALALGSSRSPGDLARGLALLDPLVTSRRPALAPWQPLARLLQGRLADQRRLEEAGERLAQQLRDQQRRIDQLSSQLEALKAIERSLNTRPPGAAGSAAQGAPPAAGRAP